MHSIFHHIHHAFRDHHHRHAMRPGHRGFSGFGGHRRGLRGGDPSQPDLDGLHRGRKLGAADLQLLLLALLAERPSHGYELIKALDERSSGYYSPSPGMVYPALTYLEEIGHASFETQGTKKLYSVTAAGLAHLQAQRAAADALLQQLSWIGSTMERLRQAMAGGGVEGRAAEDGAGAADATDADLPRGFLSGHGRGRHAFKAPEMRMAWRSLTSALTGKAGASLEEQQRIVAIVEAAAAAIRSSGPAGPAADAGTPGQG